MFAGIGIETDMVVWFVLMVFFAIVEASTVGLVSVWFALGSLVALLLSLFIDNVWVQIWAALIVSIVTLLLLRPLSQKYFSGRTHGAATNLDLLIGAEAVVTEPIDNLQATGQVKVNGQIWTARSEGELVIPAGTIVTVLRIEGVKLYVQPRAGA